MRQHITACLVAQQVHVLFKGRARRLSPCTCCRLSNLVCYRWFAVIVKGWRYKLQGEGVVGALHVTVVVAWDELTCRAVTTNQSINRTGGLLTEKAGGAWLQWWDMEWDP